MKYSKNINYISKRNKSTIELL